MAVALITGASRGLGLALARRLAADGWSLVIDARGADALAAARDELAAHTTVVAVPGDVTDPHHRAQLIAAAVELGGLDLLVNNASVLGPSPNPGWPTTRSRRSATCTRRTSSPPSGSSNSPCRACGRRAASS